MPTYCYKCSSCHDEREIVQKISEDALKTCPACQKETYKRVPPKEVAIAFKGSGFYITDYPKESSGCGTGSCGCC